MFQICLTCFSSFASVGESTFFALISSLKAKKRSGAVEKQGNHQSTRMYTLFVATDCNGEKVNLEFLFDFGPSVAQLLHKATEAFRGVYQRRGIPRIFTISASVIFNDDTSTWDRLERSTQLLHNSQVYLFQPDTLDVPGEIGDAVPAAQFLPYDYSSPARGSAGAASNAINASPRAAMPVSFDPRAPATVYASPLFEKDYLYSTPFESSGSPNPYSLAHSSKYPRSSASREGEREGSILREERERIERQEHLSLDELRGQLRKEVKEFSAGTGSPNRSLQY